jgi:hypothetical protein
MNLLIRINLALAAIFVIGALITGFACHAVLQANAEREILAQAGLMIALTTSRSATKTTISDARNAPKAVPVVLLPR